MKQSPWKRRAATAALIVVALAVSGIGFSIYLFSGWTRTRRMSPPEARSAFEAALRGPAAGPAYAEIAPDGKVTVHREIERPDPAALRTLRVMGWEPRSGRLVTVGFPWWFVRIKSTDTLNLGTLLTAASGDWKHLDLPITEEDLQRRGPGLILDHTLREGARILIWTE